MNRWYAFARSIGQLDVDGSARYAARHDGALQLIGRSAACACHWPHWQRQRPRCIRTQLFESCRHQNHHRRRPGEYRLTRQSMQVMAKIGLTSRVAYYIATGPRTLFWSAKCAIKKQSTLVGRRDHGSLGVFHPAYDELFPCIVCSIWARRYS